jgi:hypothetical protein
MASTEQRSGFRLPWASESRIDVAHDINTSRTYPTTADGAATDTAAPVAGTTNDSEAATGLGTSSEPGTTPQSSEDAVTPDTDTQPADAGSATWPQHDARLEALAPTEDPTASSEASDVDELAPLASVDSPVTHDDSTPLGSAEVAAADTDHAPADEGWPAAIDAAPRADDEASLPPRDAPHPVERSRRDNPLVAGLVRAMRDAAEVARQESLAKLGEEAKAKIEAIQAESAEGDAGIKQQADEDITTIREWSRAEMARIKDETDERIADRRQKLELEVEDHAASVEHRIERVNAAVAAFEAKMEAFFETLLAEDDPARLATYAEQLPEPPELDADTPDSWTPEGTLAPDDAAAAEAAALSDLGDDDATDLGADDQADRTWAGLPTSTETDNVMADDDVVRRLATFTGPAATDDDTETSQLSVVGLVSVASIAGFKRALGRAPGVRGVTVASGPGGDFIFTIQHAGSVDLRTIVPELEGFAATITGDADGVLTVNANEPEPAN